MPAPRGVERLLNVIMTIGSRRRITREALFSVIPDYASAPTKDAAERMFERDKAEILALGLDLRTETDPWDESVVHYRIERTDAALASLDLTEAEYTILLAASRAWDDAAAGGAARRVRAKLLSLGQEADPDLVRRTPQGSVESLPVLAPLLEAVTTRRRVTFRYRAATGRATERTVEPWVVGVQHGRWYVLGHDVDRADRRLFRASRIESFPRLGRASTTPVPGEVDLAAAVAGATSDDEVQTATFEVAPYKALTLRDRVGAPVDAGSVTVPDSSRSAARAHVLGAARWVTLTAPAGWRAELAATLTQVGELHDGQADLSVLEHGAPRERAGIRTPSSSTDHLSRLVSEASYVLSRGEVELSAMASEFGITTARLVQDLQILFVCGDLGAGWEDLIDVEWEDGWVRVRNAAALEGPLRLTASEVTALLAGLGALSAASGDEAEVLASARDKLVRALSTDADGPSSAEARAVGAPASPSPVGRGHGPETRRDLVVAAVQRALASASTLLLRYSPPDRPGTSVRTVRPLRLETTGGRAYLRAVDESSGAERTFRVDRIVELPDRVPPGETPSGTRIEHAPATDQGDAWVRLEPGAAWIAEAFEAAEVRDLPGDGGVVSRIANPVRSALVDAVLEAAGNAELLAPADLRGLVASIAHAAAEMHGERDPLG